MAVVRKTNFLGGINQQFDPTKLNPEEDFYIAINARLRKNVVEPVREPVDITAGLPTSGIMQGLFAADNILLAFISGKAYYRDFAGSDVWTPIVGYDMSPIVQRVYCELVPASTVNYLRQLNTDENVRGPVALALDTPSLLSPQCVIVMDGATQPTVIFADGTARKTQNYSQWTKTPSGMEYVPIAILPMFYNNKLYCIGKGSNGAWNQLFHSVSGQPLNFMVAINKNGEKTDSSEMVGGAYAVAGGFSYNSVTALRAINGVDGAFYASTSRASTLIYPDYNTTQFAEPVFRYQPLFSIGALNDLCITDPLGDVAVIHYNGIRSFNGVASAKWEGKNAPFSAKINALTDGIVQSYACCASFDNYNGFALMTKHGPGILWYDTLLERFVSLDLYPGVSQIKQFAEIKTPSAQRLFFSTVDNKLYEAFAGPVAANCGIYFIDLIPQNAAPAMHRIQTVNCVFSDVVADGYVQCEVFHNRVKATTQAQKIAQSNSSPGQYTAIPFNPTVDDDTVVVNFNFQTKASFSWRAGAMITWDSRANLLELSVETAEEIAPSPNRETARATVLAEPTKLIFVGDDGLIGSDRNNVFTAMAKANANYYVGLGDHAYMQGTHAQVAANLKAYWDRLHEQGRFFATPGNHDLDTAGGTAFFNYMRQPPTNYFKTSLGEFADLFVLVSGFTSVGAQLFPFNTGIPSMLYAPQYVWLKSALAASTARFKFVILHEPVYTSGAVHNAHTELQDIPFKQWGATAVLSGHNHQYERIVRDGMTYYVVGTGGSSLYDFAATPDSGSCARIKSFGYLACDVYPLSTEFRFVDVDGNVHDSWIIRK